MVRILLCGSGGAMGRTLAEMIAGRQDCQIVAGLDPTGEGYGEFPVFSTPQAVDVENIDIILDFSHPSALEGLLTFAKERGLGLVEATTGLSDQQLETLALAAEEIPVFYSPNMSLGVNLMAELAKTAARVLGRQYDIEIIEKHHNQKIDAPSGTALMLADAIREELPAPTEYVYQRENRREKRPKNEIGIHTVRGGTIVGAHEVLFAGHDEVLSISHTAASKDLFAAGAINAALFLAGKSARLYSMKDLIQ